jgi:hypothetical protein
MMGPGMFDGILNGILVILTILVVGAFLSGLLVSSCVTHVGHPTVSWSK